jgi:hypothetical protein
VSIVCGFPAFTGTGSIPAAAIARLAPGTADFSVDTADYVRTPAGTYDVDVRVLVGIATPAGKKVPSPIGVQ